MVNIFEVHLYQPFCKILCIEMDFVFLAFEKDDSKENFLKTCFRKMVHVPCMIPHITEFCCS